MKKFLSNFFNGWNVTGSPQRKNLHTFKMNLRTSRNSAPWTYGRIPCIMRSLHASLFFIFRRPKIKYFASFCIRSYLKLCITTNWRKNCIFYDTVNASRNRAFANYFLFARSANAWNKLAVRYKHVAYTGHAVSFRGPGCSRQTQFPRSRPRKLPKHVKMLKTELGNCSPLSALHQLILHRQLIFSAGCR